MTHLSKTNETTVRNVYHFPVMSVLGVVFVTLKLCGVIDWSWWLVTLPFWFWPALLLLAAGSVFLVAGIVVALSFCMTMIIGLYGSWKGTAK